MSDFSFERFIFIFLLCLGFTKEFALASMNCAKTVKVFYRSEMWAPSLNEVSQSSTKPLRFYEGLIKHDPRPVIVSDFDPLTEDEISTAHDPTYVRQILGLEIDNGFDNRSPDLARSFPYVLGSHYAAAVAAIREDENTCSPTSGFHHAGYDFCGGFCTFNGLMTTSLLLMKKMGVERVAIIDADYHRGNGTNEIIRRLKLSNSIYHYSFGYHFSDSSHVVAYLKEIDNLRATLSTFQPEIILYQAGADVHRRDPLGGIFSTEQIRERDAKVFQMARDLRIPIVWNLAGGYQDIREDGSDPVVEIHLNSYDAARRVLTNP